MSPQAALDFQIGRYREMSGEDRLAIALDLHEFSCDIAREGIRAQHPEADKNEVERLLQKAAHLGEDAMTERELLIDCLRRLNGAGLSYLLTGSMASNYWGIPRTTHDLDFVIQLPPSAVPKMMAAFSGDFFLDEAAVRAAYQPPHQFNAIDQRSTLKVDFWVLCPMPFEREMFARRQQVKLFGEPAWIGTAEDVLLHKLYWNRITPSDRQLGDAAGIVAVQQGALDTAHLRHWANELGVTHTLDEVLSGKIKPKQT